MEAVQSTEKNVKTANNSEINRNLKRNIGELATEIKVNEEPKSPARKEVKIGHETYLRRELEQWKQLINDNGIRQSIMCRDANHSETPENLNDILTDDQRQFIDDACDVQKMFVESHAFRRKFDFFVRSNKMLVNLSNEIANETIDAGREQAFRIRIEEMQYGIPRFCSKINNQQAA